MDTKEKKIISRPLHFFIIIILSILVAEGLIMLLLWAIPSLPPYIKVILDPLLLIAMVSPLLYLYLLRPMLLYISNEKRIKEKLIEIQKELERGVIERTAELNEANKFLRQSEEKYRALVKTAIDAVISIDGDGNVIMWNRAAEKMFGYTEDEAVGRPVTFIIPERFREAHKKGMERLKLTGESHVIGKTVELCGLRKGNSEFPIELSLAMWKTEKGAYFYTGIIRDITEQKRLLEKIKQLSITDNLTNAYNRRKFTEIIEKEMEKARRYNHPLSITIFDIDYFKRVNDRYGHDVGDHVLKTIADIVREKIRKTDWFIRWGGEEFVIVAPETDLEGIKILAENVRKGIGSHDFDRAGRITASFGVTGLERDDTEEALMKRADSALYRAKINGRNRIEAGV